jgi:hypothetical protein
MNAADPTTEDAEMVDEFKDLLRLRKYGELGNVIFERARNPPRLVLTLGIHSSDEDFHKAVSDLRRALNAIRGAMGKERVTE